MHCGQKVTRLFDIENTQERTRRLVGQTRSLICAIEQLRGVSIDHLRVNNKIGRYNNVKKRTNDKARNHDNNNNLWPEWQFLTWLATSML